MHLTGFSPGPENSLGGLAEEHKNEVYLFNIIINLKNIVCENN